MSNVNVPAPASSRESLPSRALEFARAQGETIAGELAQELVGLSNLNFNNTQFDTGDPITVRAARSVGDILKHVPPGRTINSRFRYFT